MDMDMCVGRTSERGFGSPAKEVEMLQHTSYHTYSIIECAMTYFCTSAACEPSGSGASLDCHLRGSQSMASVINACCIAIQEVMEILPVADNEELVTIGALHAFFEDNLFLHQPLWPV